MKILIACERSGIVRDAFDEKGHDAWSCDILPTDQPGQHIQGDVLEVIHSGIHWDMMIAFPPCTHLAVSGARWFKEKREDGRQQQGIDFFDKLWLAPIKKRCIENPIGIMSTLFRKPDQIIQPWQFGHGETKATCLWLDRLPLLKSTNIVAGRENRIHKGCGYSWNTEECKKARSKTFPGIAKAMADQWS